MRVLARPAIAILVVLGVVAAAVTSAPRTAGAQPSSVIAADDPTTLELADAAAPLTIVVAAPDVPVAAQTSPPRTVGLRSADILAAAPKTSPPRAR